MSIRIMKKLAKIFYALVLWAIAICILLIQLFMVKTFLPYNMFNNSVVKLFLYVIFLAITVLIADFLRRKIPRFYLLFVLIVSIGLLLLTIYIAN